MHKTLEEILENQQKRKGNFFLIAGPCVLEDEKMGFEIAAKVKEITDQFEIPYIFKASYKKANRSRIDSFTGIGDERALVILQSIGKEFDIPVITDIHTHEEAFQAAKYADVLQIPAFLCRQTELLVAAAKTQRVVNIKKGQFLSPHAMKFAVEKVQQSGNQHVWLTERGVSFGYGDLVVDYTGIPVMQSFDVPVVLDITHSLQKPNQTSGVTGGVPQMIETISRAGIAVGVDGIFLETHPEPAKAKSDGANMLQLNNLKNLLETLIKVRKAVM